LGGSFVISDSLEAVIVTAMGKDAAHQHFLNVIIDGQVTGLFNSADTGTQVNLGTFPEGTLVEFRLDNLTTGYSYFTGPAANNPDNVIHANLCTTDDSNLHGFGFEDMWNGGDQDYNDCMFTVTGVKIQTEVLNCCRATIRLDVAGTALLSGTVRGIPSDLVPTPSTDVRVDLLDPVTQEVLDPSRFSYTDNAGDYALNNVPWGLYWIRLTVEDADAPAQYLTYSSGANLLINSLTPVRDFQIPGLTLAEDKKTLSFHIIGDYQNGDLYTYTVVRASDNQQVTRATSTSEFLDIDLASGSYRFFITADDYEPYMYRNASGKSKIKLNTDLNLDAPLTTLPLNGCGLFDPSVTPSHSLTDNGFVLRVVMKDCYNLVPAIDGHGAIAWDSGTGRKRNPYIYNWTPASPATSVEPDTPVAGQTRYKVKFKLTNACRPLCDPTVYEVEFVESVDQNGRKKLVLDDKGLLELEKDNGEEVRSITLGEGEFYPAAGTSFDVYIIDADGVERTAVVKIPPLPLENLWVDDYDEGGGANNLGYDPVSDWFDVPITPTKVLDKSDVLKAQVHFYTFGNRAVGTGVWLTFKVVGGALDGTLVRYNPVLHPDGSGQDPDAPEIILPLFVNTQSNYFDKQVRLSEESEYLVIRLAQRGDGVDGLSDTKLPFMIQDNGQVQVKTNHLSVYTVDRKDSDGDGVSDKSDNCPDDPNKTEPGLCGCGTPDTDSDGDGTPDCAETPFFGGENSDCFINGL